MNSLTMSTITLNRTNFGPLTTVFTPAPSCSLALSDQVESVAWRAQSCSISIDSYLTFTDTLLAYDTSCFPSSTRSYTSLSDVGILVWGVYSPGLFCPAGYEKRCEGYPGSTDVFEFQFPVTGSETAAGCCPSGFECQPDVGSFANVAWRLQACTSTIQPGRSLSVGTCSGDSTPKTTELSWSDQSRDFTVVAPMIQLVWQPSDISISNCTSTTSTRATTAPKAGSEVLSTGAAVGIGVGGTVVLVAIITWTTWVFLRRRRQRREGAGMGGPDIGQDHASKTGAEPPGNRYLADDLLSPAPPGGGACEHSSSEDPSSPAVELEA